MLQITIHSLYISNSHSRSSYIKMLVKHWCILSCLFFTQLFLLISIALTVINTFSASLFDFRIGRINPGTFVAALTSRCSGHSGSPMRLSCSVSYSTPAAQPSSRSFGLSKSPLQWGQSAVSEMLSGVLSSSLLTGWQLILRIRRTFNTWVRPPGSAFEDEGGGKGDLSDHLNAAAPSCWKDDHDALTISSTSEMSPTTIICLFGAQDSVWVANRFWLPCHISKMSWTFAILCNFLSAACFFISKSFPVFVVSNSGSAPAKFPLLGGANSLTMTFSWRVEPVGFDSLQPISSRPREKLATTPTPCSMIENMSRATLPISACFVRFLLLTPPVGYVWWPKGTANLQWVGVVIIEISINLPPVLWCLRRRIRIQSGCSQ